MRDEDWVDLLREAHQEPIAPAHYAAVRARVLAELGRQRRPLWRQAWAWGLATVAVAAIMVMMFPRPVGRASWPAFLASEPTRPAEPAGQVFGPAVPVSRVASKRGGAVRRHGPILTRVKQEGRPGGPPHSEPVLIKLLTDDPNVIIYWIGE